MSVVNVTLGDGKKLNLPLGRQGENEVTAVVFDFSAWSTEFGSGTLSLSVQRHGDELPYAVTMTTSGTNATWTISDLDTAYKGTGEAQVKYTVGTKVKKSAVYKFTVNKSLGQNGEYPSPGQTWQEEIEDELADVKQDFNHFVDVESLTFTSPTEKKYILTNKYIGETVSLTPVVAESAQYSYSVYDCSEGDTFVLNGTGGTAGKLYAFLDANNKLIDYSANNKTASNLIIVAPVTSAKLVVNFVGGGTVTKGMIIPTEVNRLSNVVSAETGLKIITAKDVVIGGFSGAGGIDNDVTRLRLTSPILVKKGTKITFSCGSLYHLVWELRTRSTSGGNVITSTGWTQNDYYITKNDCWIMMAFANGSSSGTSTAIYPNDFDVNYYAHIYGASLQDKKLLYLSDFIQGGVSAYGTTESTQRIATEECVALPYGNRTKLKIHMNNDYVLGIRCGRLPYDLSSNKYWYKDGDEVTFTNYEQYYRVIIGQYTNPSNPDAGYNTIVPSDLSKVHLSIEYDFDSSDILDRNADAIETAINSFNCLSQSSHGGITQYPVIVHASDFHGDYLRCVNAFKVSDYLNADALVMSGDIVANKPINGAKWMHSLISEYKTQAVVCTGNHDVDDNSYTDAMVYGYLMQPSASALKNTSGTTYYYFDIASKNLRVIVVDLYQYGATTRSNTHMSSEQLAYICSALKSTPANYGVLMVSHTPCVDVSNLKDANYPTFFQSLRKYGFTHYDINGAPINDIVDAFIGKTTISKTYTQTGSPSSISVSDDFSGVNSGVEFIAHLTGHIHEDSICYLPTTHKQLMLNICCAVAMNGGSSYPYLADDCDITRTPYGKTQDAMNVYTIDRGSKTVRITRIGGTKTYEMNVREYMAIPYAD